MSTWTSDEFFIRVRDWDLEKGIVLRQKFGDTHGEDVGWEAAKGFFSHVASIAGVLGISRSMHDAVKSFWHKGQGFRTRDVFAEVFLPITDGMQLEFGGGIRGTRAVWITFASPFGVVKVRRNQVTFSEALTEEARRQLIILGFRSISD